MIFYTDILWSILKHISHVSGLDFRSFLEADIGSVSAHQKDDLSSCEQAFFDVAEGGYPAGRVSTSTLITEPGGKRTSRFGPLT